MAKIATDLEQSKKLAEILPIESADMYYREVSFGFYDLTTHLPDKSIFPYPKGIEAWSLSALLNTIPFVTLMKDEDGWYGECEKGTIASWNTELVDACVEMIIQLKERGLL